MSERLFICTVCLLLVLPVVMIGCGHERRLPTSVARVHQSTAAAPQRDAREGMRETGLARGRDHLTPPAAIAEAKAGLGGVFTGEQVYYQAFLTFLDVPDTADFRVALGVYLGDLLDRWDFAVSGASVNGFIATAEGRCGTDAERITVTLSHQRGQPVVWAVQRRRPCP
jgi:hypothetical protein